MIKKTLILALTALSIDAHAYAISEVQPRSVTVFKHQQFNASSKYIYGIQNNTHITQDYTISYTLCVQNKECLDKKFVIRLVSGDRISTSFDAAFPVKFGNAGAYRIAATIQVIGESSHAHSGEGTISVYN